MIRTIFFVLLTLPSDATINIFIRASNEPKYRFVKTEGDHQAVIDEDDRHEFKITDRRIKEAIRTNLNIKPDNVFVSNPTPWGNIYKQFGWDEVQRIITPINAKIVSVTSEKRLILSETYNNTSEEKKIFHAKLRKQVVSSIFSTWMMRGYVPRNVTSRYRIDIKANDVTNKHIFAYNAKFGERVLNSQLLSVGLRTGVTLSVKSKRSVLAKLYASRWDMKIKINYVARIKGTLAMNFKKAYQGHHFWSQDLNLALYNNTEGKIRRFTETIAFVYYTDPEIVVRDIAYPLKFVKLQFE